MKILTLIVLMFVHQSAFADESKIRVGLHPIPNYSEMVDGECIGVLCEAAYIIFAEGLGLDVEIVMHPWQRIQRQVENGDIDVMFAVPSDQRLAYGVSSEQPVFVSKLRIYTYANHPKMAEIEAISSVEEIKQAGLVSVTNQGNGWHANRLESREVKTIHVKDKDHIPMMLAAKRGDLAIDETPLMRRLIENKGLKNKVIETNIVFETVNSHVFVSKRSRFSNLIPQIDRVILESGILSSSED